MNLNEIIKNLAKQEEQIAEAGEDVIVARGGDIKSVGENKLAGYAVLFIDKYNPDLAEITLRPIPISIWKQAEKSLFTTITAWTKRSA